MDSIRLDNGTWLKLQTHIAQARVRRHCGFNHDAMLEIPDIHLADGLLEAPADFRIGILFDLGV